MARIIWPPLSRKSLLNLTPRQSGRPRLSAPADDQDRPVECDSLAGDRLTAPTPRPKRHAGARPRLPPLRRSAGRSTSTPLCRRTASGRIGASGLVQKIRDNVAAIKTFKEIEAEDRLAIPAEQKILVKFAGWGRLPEIPRWWKRGSALLPSRRFSRITTRRSRDGCLFGQISQNWLGATGGIRMKTLTAKDATRARDHLLVSGVDPASEFLDDFMKGDQVRTSHG